MPHTALNVGRAMVFDYLLRVQGHLQAPSTPTPPPSPAHLPAAPEGWLDQFLAFIYTMAHWVGGLIVGLVENIIPLQTPANLIDPIGYLALLTVFLIVAEVAKKVVWGIVVVGWILIGVRVTLEVLQKQP
jgi:hypothetical protein